MFAHELRASRKLVQELGEIARAAYPEEGCAVLIGHERQGATALDTVLPARNVAPENRRKRFTIDPQILLAAQKAVRRRENGVVVFFHSHPDHPATPSCSDRTAAWPGALHLIASVTDRGVVDLAAYVLDASGEFRSLALSVASRSEAGVLS